MGAALPSGRTGRVLALGLTLAVAALAWEAAGHPLVEWYGERAERIEERDTLARRMAALAATLPELRRDAARRGAPAPELLEGTTDAVAAATLQERVGDMAVRSGVTPSSLEVLPARQNGPYREIGVRVALTAPWPVLVRLLQAVADASPRLLVDDLQLRAPPVAGGVAEPPLDASLAVLAFRAGPAPAGAAPAGAGAGATPAGGPGR